MNKLFSTLFSSIRAKAIGLWNKLRLWTSPTFWQTKGITMLREAFSRLFDVKPKNKKDYYPVLLWLVSKRLAYALVVTLCIGCLYLLFLLSPKLLPAKETNPIRAYRYNSIPLKFYKGTVQILAADGHTAYIGEVTDGSANGQGALYNAGGELVYEGLFANSRFNGAGSSYYSGAATCYTGDFTDNLYNGKGKKFRPNGILEYQGDYAAGVRSGSGELFNASGNKIYSGSFRDNTIVYGELLGKTTAEAAALYTGTSRLYSSAGDTCAAMEEIGAVCALADGAASLEQEWLIRDVYVLADTFVLNGKVCDTLDSLSDVLGPAEYGGTAAVTLPEAVAINLLTGGAAERFGKIAMTTTADFDEVLTVSAFDNTASVALYTFQKDDLLYRFYAEKGGTNRFDFYSISAVD